MAAKQSLLSSHLHRFRPFLMLMHGWIYPRFHLCARRPNFWLTRQTNFHSIWVRSCFTLKRGTRSWQIMWRQRAGHSSGWVWPALKMWWDRPRKVWVLRQEGTKQRRREIESALTEGIQWLFAGTLWSSYVLCPQQTSLWNHHFNPKNFDASRFNCMASSLTIYGMSLLVACVQLQYILYVASWPWLNWAVAGLDHWWDFFSQHLKLPASTVVQKVEWSLYKPRLGDETW